MTFELTIEKRGSDYYTLVDAYGERLGSVESRLVVGKRGAIHGRTLNCYDAMGQLFHVAGSMEHALDMFEKRYLERK